MILNTDVLRNMFANDKLADVYISHRVNGESFRSIAERYGLDHSTIYDNWVRACGHVKLELERELARADYETTRKRTAGMPDKQNYPDHVFYVNGHTHKNTLTVPGIRPYVLAHCGGLVLDAFAGTTRLTKEGCTFVTNDIAPTITDVNFNLDCSSHDFVHVLQSTGLKTFNTILVDPPWSLYLAKRKYNGRWYRDYTLVKNNLDKFAAVGTKVISFGFNSTGFGIRRGYEKEELLVVNVKGNHNDILVLVERKVHMILSEEEVYTHVEIEK